MLNKVNKETLYGFEKIHMSHIQPVSRIVIASSSTFFTFATMNEMYIINCIHQIDRENFSPIICFL
jgi:hypothetical protein